MKLFLLLLFVFALSATSYAQDFPSENISNEELAMKTYKGDTSAHALVLNEYGNSSIRVTSENEIPVIYKYHAKIKIFDKKGYDEGKFSIPVYVGNSSNNEFEDVQDIKGSTYVIDNSGNMQKKELDLKNVYKIKINKLWTEVKFDLPGIEDGCIIEVSYTVISPYHYNFHSWEFQSNIPKLKSTYEVHIPGFWTYNVSLRGPLKLTSQKSELERECFNFRGAKSDCSHLTYEMTNIPAFVEEDDMTAPKNFLSAMYFELSEYQSMETGAKIKYAKEWKDIDYQLKNEEEFGSQIKRKELMKERIAAAIQGKTDNLEKAKAVYAYLQKWYKWNNVGGCYSHDGIRKAFDSHTGSVGDINLSLVASLNAAGLTAEAVMLSTRDNGNINKLYPQVGDFNYVIARLDIGDKFYLLDATDPLLPFGVLPLRCLNDQGRVMCFDKPSYWMDMTTNQRKGDTYTLDLTLADNGKIKGTIIHYSLGYESYLKRKAIKKFNTIDEYVESLNENSHKMKILKSDITGIDSLDQPIKEQFEVEISPAFGGSANKDRIAFNPFILDFMATNPYKLAERTYPVDWGMPSDARYVLTMHLPEQYIVENPPKDYALGMPNQGGKFIINFIGEGNSFTFSHVKQFNKSVYSPEEYPYLKEFFNRMIQSEKGDIVFKKKS